MRQLALALACLCTLAMAQNVLAIAPVPAVVEDARSGAGFSMRAAEAAAGPLVGAARRAQSTPPVSSTALLWVGLAGLTAAGGRRERVPGEVA